CDRDYHHHYGAGDESTAWRWPGSIGAAAAGVPELRPKFSLCRHLLEQPSSHAARLYHSDGCDALGKSAPVVLALAISVHHRVDGGEPFHFAAHRGLRSSAVDGWNRILPASASDHPRARAGLDLEESDRARLEGQAIAGAVYRSHRGDPAFLVDRAGDF